MPNQQFEFTKNFPLKSSAGESVGTILLSITAQDISTRNFSNGEELALPKAYLGPCHASYSHLPHSAGSYEDVRKEEKEDDKSELQEIKRELTEQNDSIR